MSGAPHWVEGALDALVKTGPEIFSLIKRWVAKEEAKRVEEVRPAESFTDQAIAEQDGRKP